MFIRRFFSSELVDGVVEGGVVEGGVVVGGVVGVVIGWGVGVVSFVLVFRRNNSYFRMLCFMIVVSFLKFIMLRD